MGACAHAVDLVECLYELICMVVRVDDEEPEALQAQKGMGQGCILSPQLFNMYGEHIILKALGHGTGGISIGGRKISNLRCADNTTLIASDDEEIADHVTMVKISSEKL